VPYEVPENMRLPEPDYLNKLNVSTEVPSHYYSNQPRLEYKPGKGKGIDNPFTPRPLAEMKLEEAAAGKATRPAINLPDASTNQLLPNFHQLPENIRAYYEAHPNELFKADPIIQAAFKQLDKAHKPASAFKAPKKNLPGIPEKIPESEYVPPSDLDMIGEDAASAHALGRDVPEDKLLTADEHDMHQAYQSGYRPDEDLTLFSKNADIAKIDIKRSVFGKKYLDGQIPSFGNLTPSEQGAISKVADNINRDPDTWNELYHRGVLNRPHSDYEVQSTEMLHPDDLISLMNEVSTKKDILGGN